MNQKTSIPTAALQDHLRAVVAASPGVQGVVAGLTDASETTFLGAAGVRTVGESAAMTTDSVFCLFSTTKAITATAVLQCVEEGLLDLDAPASTYIPDIGALQVIEGFDGAGAPILRAPRVDITLRHLLLHTAGLAYDFFNETYAKLAAEHGQLSIISGLKASLQTPLIFDPGERWNYGSGLDWAGLAVEQVRKARLEDVFAERIFTPAGMSSTSFTISADMRSRLVPVHARLADGSLVSTPIELPAESELQNGGHGLYGTVGDYLAFLRVWLNDGLGSGGRVLSPETVLMAVKNGLTFDVPDVIPAPNPELSNLVDLHPGTKKGWSLAFMTNEEPMPTGRPAGSLAWAGLGNLYFWLDRSTGIAGYWATQILPFWDATSLNGFTKFESLVYGTE